MTTNEAPRTTAANPASVQVRCPRCEEMFFLSVEDRGRETNGGGAAAKAGGGACPRCGLEGLEREASLSAATPVDTCSVCGNGEFYLQKDFNRQLGFAIVAASALLVFLIMLWKGHRVGIVVLGGIAVVDGLLYHFVPTVTVCYLCHSIYRGWPPNPRHTGFYLGLEEKHKQLRQEWLKKIST